VDKKAIQKNIDKNRDMINDIVLSDLNPTDKKELITILSDSNKKLIEKLKMIKTK
jgi:hypothetical protein